MKFEEMKPMKIGTFTNYYYSDLLIKRTAEGYFWCTEDWEGTDWQRIPAYLYMALLRYEKGRKK